MAVSKRKILIRLAAVVFCCMLLAVAVVVGVISREFTKFDRLKREHAAAKATVTNAIEPVLQWERRAIHSADSKPTTATKDVVIAADELRALQKELEGHRPVLEFQNRPFIVVRMGTNFPAADFPDEGTTGTIPCRPALRRRIAEYAAMRACSADRYLDSRKASSTDIMTTGTGWMPPLLDRTERLFTRDNWQWPDPDRGGMSPSPFAYVGYLSEWAWLRANLAGRQEVAGKMFVNMVRAHIYLLLQMHTVPRQGRTWPVDLNDILTGAIGGEGIGGRAGLAEAAELLAKARLNEAQVKELRAMTAIDLDKHEEALPDDDDQPRRTGIVRRVLGNKIADLLNKGFYVYEGMLIRPSARAWVEGDETAYIASTDRTVGINRMTEKVGVFCWTNLMFPPVSGFGGEHPFNEEIERLQVLVALARYRQDHGRYPENILELAPRYIEASILSRSNSAWGITRTPAAAYPAYLYEGEKPMTPHEKDFKEAVEKYREKFNRLPQSPADLRGVGFNDNGTTATQSYFRTLPERPVVFRVRRISFHRAYLDWGRDDPEFDYLGRAIRPGDERIEALHVEATFPMPERNRPEILQLLKSN